MSTASLLVAALAGLADDALYPLVAPEEAPALRIVYQQIGGTAINYEEGTLPDRENCRMQLAVWGPRLAEVTDLAKQVEARILAATAFQATALGNRTETFEPDTKRYGTRQDFSIWAPR